MGLNQYAVYNNHEYIDVYTNETIDVSKFPALNFVSKKQINTMLTNSIQVNYEVPFASYFKALDGLVNSFPLNSSGDCGYVAATLLLSYFANFYNSDIICEHYMNIAPTNYLENTWQYVSCATTSFKNDLLKKNISDNSSTSFSVSDAINNYMENYTDISFDYTIGLLQSTNQIKSIIKACTPVIMFTNVHDLTNEEYIDKHAVLIYGVSYHEGLELDRLIAHLGYTNRSNVEVANSVLGVSGTTYYIDPKSIEHKHSNYYKLEGQAFCQNCQTTAFYNPVGYIYTSKNESSHNKICVCCGYTSTESHSFMIKVDKKVCSKCSFITTADNPFEPIKYE